MRPAWMPRALVLAAIVAGGAGLYAMTVRSRSDTAPAPAGQAAAGAAPDDSTTDASVQTGGVQPRETTSADSRRREMVEEQIRARGIENARVLDALRKVRRDRFVPEELADRAYDDSPLPIGFNQTISQPYIVAYMTDALAVEAGHTVLEIGTGSGYQAAVLGELARTVYTIEIVPALAQRAAETLKALGYANVHVRAGDGYAGWPGRAPFDRIMVTAAPDEIPEPLLEQLAPGGRLVIPVGAQGQTQWMTVVDKTEGGVVSRQTIPVQFVPFTRAPR